MTRNFVALLVVAFLGGRSLANAESVNIEYLCADWGPAMKLPSKPGEKPQFSDTEEEIYLLKQVSGRGVDIYLCKMKPDGEQKTEIKELWRSPNFPIDTQGQSTWVDVNENTHKIALSITYAGSDITGLWTMNLDGSDIQRIITPTMIDGHMQAINHPSWTPDGQWIVFEEELRGTNPNQYRIAKCDHQGKAILRLTDGPHDQQPSVSPDGAQVVYVHNPMKKLGENGGGELWVAPTLMLMDLHGSNGHEIPNPEAKPSWPAKGVSGSWPTWSPDGKRLFAVSVGVVDAATGKKLGYGAPKVQNWPELNGKPANIVMPHWGKLGLLCSGWGGGIQLSDEAMEKMWVLASSDIQKGGNW